MYHGFFCLHLGEWIDLVDDWLLWLHWGEWIGLEDLLLLCLHWWERIDLVDHRFLCLHWWGRLDIVRCFCCFEACSRSNSIELLAASLSLYFQFPCCDLSFACGSPYFGFFARHLSTGITFPRSISTVPFFRNLLEAIFQAVTALCLKSTVCLTRFAMTWVSL